MGYHLTILRSSQGRQIPIALEEGKVAARDLGWECQDFPSTFFRLTEEGTCTLWYQDGKLWVKNPAPWEIERLLALAMHLDARVRGDEFEPYESIGKTFFHPDDRQLRKDVEALESSLIAINA